MPKHPPLRVHTGGYVYRGILLFCDMECPPDYRWRTAFPLHRLTGMATTPSGRTLAVLIELIDGFLDNPV
jgi:hypothetical protein